MEAVDCIYLDPDRRSNSGKKLMLIEDCAPNLIEIQDLLWEKANQILIKLSPMLDIHAAFKIWESIQAIHIISVENECKELLFLLEKGNTKEAIITTINLKKNGNHQRLSFPVSEEKEIAINYTSQLEIYLYEPNVSLLKAGFFKGLAHRYQLKKLHSDSHLYTSSQLIADFPGRIFKIEAVYSMSKSDLSRLSKEIEKANITVRNFPLSVAKLRKKLKLKEGGDDYLFATTLANGKHILVRCKKLSN